MSIVPTISNRRGALGAVFDIAGEAGLTPLVDVLLGRVVFTRSYQFAASRDKLVELTKAWMEKE
jgi:hypothetical protein